ncbi:hypothetical protein BpHYR1_008702 [Brachionus plicatilis]|uniref:Uncharacterized protein n=1 Tax=Brachionus plicatilis TaxID=10195 RepID=A0A3M7TB32_BRAPC|nr:hypothetical protein BpHYR1_008702 [Brachionus plicatilis]
MKDSFKKREKEPMDLSKERTCNIHLVLLSLSMYELFALKSNYFRSTEFANLRNIAKYCFNKLADFQSIKKNFDLFVLTPSMHFIKSPSHIFSSDLGTGNGMIYYIKGKTIFNLWACLWLKDC